MVIDERLQRSSSGQWLDAMKFSQDLRDIAHAEHIVQRQHQQHMSFLVREAFVGEEFKYPTGAFALICRHNQTNGLEVLLVFRPDYQIWNLPGGGADAYEPLDAAAARETYEETGLQVIPTGTLLFVKSDPIPTGSPIGSESREDIFSLAACFVAEGSLSLTDESQKIGWFPINNLPSSLFSRHRWAIQKALSDPDLRTIVEESIEKHQVDPHTLELQ